MLPKICAYILYALSLKISVANGEIVSNIFSNAIEASLLERVILTGETGVKSELCNKKPCIRKCCGINDVVMMLGDTDDSGSCKNRKNLTAVQISKIKEPFPNPPVYTGDLKKSEKLFFDTFRTIKGDKILHNGRHVYQKYNWYVIENGTLVVDRYNLYNRWQTYDEDHFCVDNVILVDDQVMLLPFILNDKKHTSKPSKLVSLIALPISCVFLIATLAVYSSLVRLRRKLHGKIVLAFTACTLAFFLIQAIHQVVYEINDRIYPDVLCHFRSMTCYYLILTSLFWMNIMAYDIWLQYRSLTRCYIVNRKEQRFWRYCVLGFGAPFTVAIIYALLNYLPIHSLQNRAVITPGITDKNCFLEGMERLLYLLIPMAIVIAIASILLVSTATMMHSLYKNSEAVIDHSHNKQFVTYVKLLILVAVTWVLEIAYIYSTDQFHFMWEVIDGFNSLKGFFVFVIFVCNKRVIKILKQRCRGSRRTSQYASARTNDDQNSN